MRQVRVFHKWVRWKLWQISIKSLFLNIRVGIRVRGLHLVFVFSGTALFLNTSCFFGGIIYLPWAGCKNWGMSAKWVRLRRDQPEESGSCRGTQWRVGNVVCPWVGGAFPHCKRIGCKVYKRCIVIDRLDIVDPDIPKIDMKSSYRVIPKMDKEMIRTCCCFESLCLPVSSFLDILKSRKNKAKSSKYGNIKWEH